MPLIKSAVGRVDETHVGVCLRVYICALCGFACTNAPKADRMGSPLALELAL